MDSKSRQSAPLVQSPRIEPGAPRPPGRAEPDRRRVWAARFVALAADATQFALLPLVMAGAVSPVSDVIDVATAILLTWLVGWHWAFLPAFVAEVVPFVDLVPTWTLAVFIATRRHKPSTRS